MDNTTIGSLDSLKHGETLLVNARKVKNDKIHLEFAEIVNNQTAVNVLGLLNKSDDAFSNRARRAWVTAEPTDATEYFGINFGPTADWYMGDKGEMLDLNILNPTMNDIRCRLKIEETIEGTDWQNDNITTAAKRRGKEGDYITHLGAYIFSNTSVVLSEVEAEHELLEADVSTSVTSKQVKSTAVEELSSLM